MEFDELTGEALVRVARMIIESHLSGGLDGFAEDIKTLPSIKAGVFVTLLKRAQGMDELRGCIGVPLPEKPMLEALREAAIGAASRDPRFEPIFSTEMDDVKVEVSVLTEPELIKVASPLEYPSKIGIGKDGLMVTWRHGSGLLLPQVPVEQGWNSEEFLSYCCMKAEAPPDAWLLPGTKVYRFQAQAFSETEPRGRVVKRSLEK